MRIRSALAVCVCLFVAGLVQSASALAPNPLENAYWRFEEGANGQVIPPGDGTVHDSLNQNHMKRFRDPDFPDANSPIYTTDVPASVVPATGAENTLALVFSGTFQDLYTGVDDAGAPARNINNPIVNAFTLEASFKANVVGGGAGNDHTIVSKESTSDDTSRAEPPLALKVMGDTSKLRIELRDKANNVLHVDSQDAIETLKWYHAAVVATSTEVKLYLNKNDGIGYVLQGTTTIPGGGPLWQGTKPADGYETVWNIGKGMWNRALAYWWNGVIDEVRLSNTALDPSQFLFKPVPNADFDHSGRIDANDLFIFEKCSTGPAVPYSVGNLPPGCNQIPDAEGIIPADLDRDHDVDQDDFAVFQVQYTG